MHVSVEDRAAAGSGARAAGDGAAGDGAAAAALTEIAGVRQAVIDIGSNSVRLVIYDGPARAPYAICNEKALCGLGRNMESDGRLNPTAVNAAIATLARFRRLLNAHGDVPVIAVATAAVREAADGAAFAERVRGVGFDIDILSGDREAETAALGVVSLEPDAEGLVSDMGGGSLELIELVRGAAERATSLSIGPFRLLARAKDDQAQACEVVQGELGGVEWLRCAAGTTLFGVGGAGRAIARIHMRLRGHPLSVLHNYEIPAREAADLCAFISRQSGRSLAEIPGLPRKRIETLPYAALALGELITRSRVSAVRISAGGVREGLLYERLNAQEKALHPLLAGAAYIGKIYATAPCSGPAAAAAIAPLFNDPAVEAGGRWARAREAACLMIDIGAYAHPDHRGQHVFDTILRTPLYGVEQVEKVALAHALHVRHDGLSSTPYDEALRLLDDDARQWAERLGLALRFMAAFAPKTPSLVAASRFEREGDEIVFRCPADFAPLWEELPQRRLDAVGAAFGVNARPLFED